MKCSFLESSPWLVLCNSSFPWPAQRWYVQRRALPVSTWEVAFPVPEAPTTSRPSITVLSAVDITVSGLATKAWAAYWSRPKKHFHLSNWGPSGHSIVSLIRDTTKGSETKVARTHLPPIAVHDWIEKVSSVDQSSSLLADQRCQQSWP